MKKNNNIHLLQDEFLKTLYQYEPSTAFGIIETVLIAWGYQRKKVVGQTIVEHERDVAYTFMRALEKLIGNKTPSSVRQAGKNRISSSDDELEKLWAKRWHAFPYEDAMQAFVESVYQWLDETDLRNQITDDSPNHFVFYMRQWWMLNS